MPVKVPVKTKDRRSPPVATTRREPSGKTLSLISDAKLKQLYATMLRSRILNERLSQLHKQEKWPGKYLSSSGREAAAVGTAIDLRRADLIMPTSRDAITSFIKGVPLDVILTRLISTRGSLFDGLPGKSQDAGSPSGDSGSAFPNVLPPASNLAVQAGIAAGAAFAAQSKQSGSVVMAFWTDSLSGPPQEIWHDSLRYAAIRCLPLVFVAHGEVSLSDIPRQKTNGSTKAGLLTQLCNVPVIPVDGNDVVAVYRVSHESVHKARHGGGPTLIEAKSLIPSIGDGKTPALSSDPVVKMESYLTGKGLFSSAWKQTVADSFHRNLDVALEIAKA